MRRVLTLIRRHFPDTHILVRGDGHFSVPELMGLIDSMPNTDFIFGFSCNVKLLALAEPARLQCKNRIVLHLPSACPVKDLLRTLTECLFLSPPVKIVNSS